MIELLALDIDGTTLCSDNTLADKTKQAIESVIDEGIVVVLVTGRVLYEIPLELKAIEGIRYVITSNGASIVDLKKNKEIYSKGIGMEKANEVIHLLSKYDVFTEIYYEGRARAEKRYVDKLRNYGIPDNYLKYVQHSVEWVENLEIFRIKQKKQAEKMYITFPNTKLKNEVYREALKIPDIYLTSSAYYNLEISHAEVNKANSLQMLCEYLKISETKTMAIGDSYNDKEMLKRAQIAVAMGNADERIKSIADFVTLSNDEDGVAYAINKFIY
jgi:Cof subfamily protein (haloacid dehalogenase superfamily)